MTEKIKYELVPGVQVNFIKNQQFKSVQVMVSFIRELTDQKELAKRTLLTSMFESSSAHYPNQHAITLKLAELYGATFGANTEVEGNLSLLNFIYSFVAPEYLSDGQSLLTESINFLNEIIFHPLLIDGKFKTEVFERQRENLINYLKGIVDNKQTEALINAQRLYFDSAIQQNTPYGTVADYQGLTNQQIVDEYYRTINEDQVQITIMGDLDLEELKQQLINFELKKRTTKPDQACYHQAVKDNVIVKEKQENVQQSKLNLIYQLPIDAVHKDFYAAVVMNAMLGESPQSLLFQNVREKASMAYYAESSYSALRSVVLIQTGIQAEDHDQVLALVKQQISLLQNGDFSDDQLEKIKIELVNERQRMQDSPASNLEQAVLSELLEQPLDYEIQCREIKKVMKEDIIRVAKQLTLQTEFFLKGVMDNGND